MTEANGNIAEKQYTPPSTLKGLKREAVRVKRRDGITHTQALNVVAQMMGYGGYAHARKELEKKEQDEKLGL